MIHQTSDIHKACREGSLLHLKEAVHGSSSRSINQGNEEGLCPIHVAVLYNDWNTSQGLLSVLIQNGADINITDRRSGDSILHLCLSFKHSDDAKKLVPFLLKKGANASIKNYEGKSAADVARDNGYSDLELLLRDYPDNKPIADRTDVVPPSKMNFHSTEKSALEKSRVNDDLMASILSSDIENIRRLLEEGADANVDLMNSYRPIHFAVSKGQTNPVSILELLENHSAQMDVKTEENDTILTLAIKKIENEDICLRVVEYLRGCGISINDYDNDGNNAVTLASLRHFETIVKILLSIHDFEGPYHPIHTICRNKNLNETKKLQFLEEPYFKNNVSPDIRTKPEDETCLHIACRNSEVQVVECLLQRNAQVRVTNKSGETPLSITRDITKNVTIEKMLMEADERQNGREEEVQEKEETIAKIEAPKKRCTIL